VLKFGEEREFLPSLLEEVSLQGHTLLKEDPLGHQGGSAIVPAIFWVLACNDPILHMRCTFLLLFS